MATAVALVAASLPTVAPLQCTGTFVHAAACERIDPGKCASAPMYVRVNGTDTVQCAPHVLASGATACGAARACTPPRPCRGAHTWSCADVSECDAHYENADGDAMRPCVADEHELECEAAPSDACLPAHCSHYGGEDDLVEAMRRRKMGYCGTCDPGVAQRWLPPSPPPSRPPTGCVDDADCAYACGCAHLYGVGGGRCTLVSVICTGQRCITMSGRHRMCICAPDDRV